MRYIETEDGIPIHYVDEGPSEVLYLIHGADPTSDLSAFPTSFVSHYR